MADFETNAQLLDLHDQVAIVTGSRGGIGRAVCEHLHKAGAKVVGFDLESTPEFAGVESMAVDVSSSDQVTNAVAEVAARHGRIDIAVHSAGITRDAMVWKLTDHAWDQVLAVNLTSAFYLIRAITPTMRRAGCGVVVLIASINGERGKLGQANYAASKGGLIALGKTTARDVGRFGIRVNVIAPGFVETPMTSSLPEAVKERARSESVLGRLGSPDDIAGATLFLCCPQLSRHITGQVLRVDGGQLIC